MGSKFEHNNLYCYAIEDLSFIFIFLKNNICFFFKKKDEKPISLSKINKKKTQLKHTSMSLA